MPLSIDYRPDYKGKLIRVPVKGRPGTFIKMTEEEAMARGLMAPRGEAAKKREPARNKRRTTAENK